MDVIFTRHARVWSGSGGRGQLVGVETLYTKMLSVAVYRIITPHCAPVLYAKRRGKEGTLLMRNPSTQETGVLEGSPQRVRATVYPPNPGAAVSHGKARIVVVTSSQLTRETPCGFCGLCAVFPSVFRRRWFFNKLQTQEVAPFVYFIRQTSSQPAERGSWIALWRRLHISPDLASCVIDATSGSHDTYLK